MKRIAILSDSHGLIREEVKEQLQNADVILHAGDINTEAIVDELKKYGPLYIVRGNNDKEWAINLPITETVTIEGVRFFLVHNKKEIPTDVSKYDVIIYGHSHKYEEKQIDGIWYLNPGSCGKRRFNQEITMCEMEIQDGSFQVRKICIPHTKE
ncbi:MAG: metallophosphoesterase family protein [Lachnospiraceae bacterium]